MSNTPEQMGRTVEYRVVSLGGIEPARSRHAGRRSAVALTEDAVVVGTAAGDVLAYDRETLDERWRAESSNERAAVVFVAPFSGGIVVGERGSYGEVRLHDSQTGETCWRYATAEDIGDPQKQSRFFLPFVVDITSDEKRLYAAARRYERDGENRSFTSVVYAFDADGDVSWTYETDASPISLDVCDSRLAVAYNRCPGTHQSGLVVLDTETGAELHGWDPGTDGERRVGDVSLMENRASVTSHGDYRGYLLGADGTERWQTDLATPVEIDDETLYSYPNHVHATDDAIVFITGNTYSTEGRKTDSLHPDEHTIFGYCDGERIWTDSVGGFAGEIATDGDSVAVPGAQHFRARDSAIHGLRMFEVNTGSRTTLETNGIVTAVTLDDETFAAIEEPVVYHDEGTNHGAYQLLVGSIGQK
nr:PQQ-binding-like beta-propeller repeat protein [Halococcus thailandensis]